MCLIALATVGAGYSAGTGITGGALAGALGTDLLIGGMLAGTGLSAYSSVQAGKFNRDMMRYQAKLNDRRAGEAVRAANFEADQESRRRKQLIASGTVTAAEHGVLIDQAPTSAPTLWEQDQNAMLAFDRQLILENAQSQSWAFRSESAMQRKQAKQTMQSAKLGAWTSGVSGVGSAAATSMLI